MFRFAGKHQNVFQILHSNQCLRAPVVFTSWLVSFVRIPELGHSNWRVAVSHYFNLHFSHGIWCGVSFQMPTCHLHIFFVWKTGVLRSLVHFFNWIDLLLLSFKSSLCILDSNPLSDVSFVNIFSQSIVCLQILLILSFAEQKF